jgi:hypothetical protein
MMTNYQSKAQGPNLVPNPSFENYTLPPTPSVGTIDNPVGYMWIVRLNDPTFTFHDPDYAPGDDQRHVHDWFRGNQATSDYYLTMPTTGPKPYKPFDDTKENAGVNVPENWGQEGYLYASNGNAYAGIAILRSPIKSGITPGADDWHEYLAIKLSSALQHGKKYSIKFKYAIPDYLNDRQKSNNKSKSPFYLTNLGVAFASDISFLDYNQTGKWYDKTHNSHFTSLNSSTIVLNNDNYVENDNVEYAPTGQWKEFEVYFQCPATVNTLQYIAIGNFQYRIPLSDISQRPEFTTSTLSKTEEDNYSMYFFIDDVEVRQLETGACNCGSIFTCPHTRNETLEESHPNKCCFTTPIIPDKTKSCAFQSVRITVNGVVVSNPALVSYNGTTTNFPDPLEASFCIDKVTDESQTLIKYEFLDADGNILCFKQEYVQCNCMCDLAGSQIAGPDRKAVDWVIRLTLTKVDNENGNCCWEYSLKNNWSCTFLEHYGLEVDLPTGTTITSIAPWTETHVGTKYFFASTTGLKYNNGINDNTSKIFKICTTPQTGNTTEPIIKLKIKENTSQDICKNCPDIKLECKGSENCCNQIDIELQGWGYITEGGCKFNLNIRQKNSSVKCDVYGFRIKSSTGVILHTTTTGSVLNLDKQTLIWTESLGGCVGLLLNGELVANCKTYTIEVLGPNDPQGNPTVKCSVQKEFCCCNPQQNNSKKTFEVETQELSSGGRIAETTIEGDNLRYTIKNNGDALAATLRLTSLKGDILMEQKRSVAKGNSVGEFNISQFSSGVYYLSIQTDLWQTTRQIVIVR